MHSDLIILICCSGKFRIFFDGVGFKSWSFLVIESWPFYDNIVFQNKAKWVWPRTPLDMFQIICILREICLKTDHFITLIMRLFRNSENIVISLIMCFTTLILSEIINWIFKGLKSTFKAFWSIKRSLVTS